MNRAHFKLTKTGKDLFLVLFLFIFSLASGCAGKNEKKTDVAVGLKFKIGALVDAGIGSGGALIWGKKAGGADGFARIISAGGPDLLLTLANGDWTFYAMAFYGSGGASMAGTVRCASAPGVLKGDKLSVTLILTNAKCAGTTFSEHGMTSVSSVYSFPSLDIGSCSDLSSISTGDTTGISTCMEKAGNMKSFKVHLPEYNKVAGAIFLKSNKISSSCISMSTSPTTALSVTNLPVVIGSPGSPFYTQIEGFYNSYDCGVTQNNSSRVIDFPNGVGANDDGSYKTFSSTSVGVITVMAFLKTTDSELCQGARSTDTTKYAGGDGTTYNPYHICSTLQWNAYAAAWSSTLATKAIRLAANLDFNFSTFTPMGDAMSGAVSNSFSNTFYGGNHTISNVLLSYTDKSSVGIFRSLTSGGTITKLIVENVYLSLETDSVQSYVGGLVGQVVGTSTLSNIKLNGFIDSGGDSYTSGLGLLVGTAGTSAVLTISEVDIYGVISSQSLGVASLVGLGSGCTLITISKSSASGEVRGSTEIADTKIGGLVGGSDCDIAMSESLYKGKVSGKSKVGGLVGYGSNVVISDSYAVASVASYLTQSDVVNVGGLVGAMTTGTLTRVMAPEAAVTSRQYNPTSAGVGDNMAYTGGIVGSKGSGSCTYAYFVGPNNTSGTFGGNAVVYQGCGSEKTPTTILDVGTYSATWSNVGSSSTTGSTVWVHKTADDTYDYPRLRWEYDRESSVTYLQRPCSGYFATTVGSGTATSPYWICSTSQFSSMSASYYYILKRNLDLRGTTLNNTTSTFLGTGAYKFDGNDLNLYGPFIDINGASTSAAIIDTLSAGGYFKNINIFGAKTNVTYGGAIVGAKAAVVALTNAGTIDQVYIDNSSVNFLSNYLQDSTGSIKLSSYVIDNSGTLSNGEIESYMTLYPTSTDTYNGYVYFANAAYENTGTISAIRTDGEIKIKGTVAADMSTTRWFGSGMVIHNTGGTISNSEVDGHLNTEFTVTPGGYGTMAGFVAGNNTGTLTNVLSEMSFYFTRYNGYAVGLVGNHTGTITRGIYLPSAGMEVEKYLPTVYGKKISGAGTLTEVYCGSPWLYSESDTWTSSGTTSFTNSNSTINTALSSISVGSRVCLDSTCDYLTSYTSGSPGTVTTDTAIASGGYSWFNIGMLMSDCSENLSFTNSSGVLQIKAVDLGVVGSNMANTSWSVTSDIDSPGSSLWYYNSSNTPSPVAIDTLFNEGVLDSAYFQ